MKILNVEATVNDSEAPTITDVNIDRNTATAGDQIIVTAKITDESGIDVSSCRASILGENSTSKDYKSYIMKKQSDGTYAATIPIDETWINQTYYISSISADDIYGNYKYYGLNKKLSFSVFGCINDSEAPTITDVNIDRNTATAGDQIIVTAKITDESGIDASSCRASILGENSTSKDYKSYTMKKQSDGTYAATIPIDETWINQTYYISSISADDIYGNHKYYGLNRKLSFSVTDGKGKIVLAGYTTSLNGTISMNFYMELGENIVADDNTRMQFTLPGINHTSETVYLSDARKQERNGKTYYVFSAGVAAKDMTSDIKAKLVWSGGESEEWSYTIKQYCDYIRNHPDEYDMESVNLVKNMLNYGGYAQTYFNYHTDRLANSGVEIGLPEPELDESFDPLISGSCTGLKYLGSSAMLTTTTGLRHYFDITDDIKDYSFKANGKTLAINSDKNGYYVFIDNIKARDLSNPIVLVVTNKDGSKFTMAYSVYANIRQVINGNFSKESQDLMRALYGYGEAAKEFFAANS